MTDKSDYERKAEVEQRHFEGIASFNPLASILGWWAPRYLTPRVQRIFGTATHIQFYGDPIARLCERGDATVRVASIGSGDGTVEIQVARYLLEKRRVRNFKLTGFDLSPVLVERASSKIDVALAEHVAFACADINSGLAAGSVDVVVFNQVLHHIVELEALFDAVGEILAPDGIVLIRDMIGRNGHRAWPEALEVIDSIWKAMPARYRYHHVHKREYAAFPDIDMSSQSFEGIRAQDILPLLVEHPSLHFSKFYAWGGVVDRFISQGFGPNYDATREDDQAFLHVLSLLTDELNDSGRVKPVQMVAEMVRRPASCSHWPSRSPAACIRPPDPA